MSAGFRISPKRHTKFPKSLTSAFYRGAAVWSTRKVRKAHRNSSSSLPRALPHLHFHPFPEKKGDRPLSSPEGGGEGEHPTKCTEGVICKHGFGGAHTQSSPERRQKRARRQFAFPDPPSPAGGSERAAPGGRGEPGGEGGERRNRPFFSPGPAPEHTREARKPPGVCWGTRRSRGPGASPGGEAVPATGVAPPAAAGRGGPGL